MKISNDQSNVQDGFVRVVGYECVSKKLPGSVCTLNKMREMTRQLLSENAPFSPNDNFYFLITCNVEQEPSVRDLPNFLPVHKYRQELYAKALPNEIGMSERLRFVVIE